MNTIEIRGMVEALRPVLKNRIRAAAILEKYWSKDRFALIWTVQDIHKAANERGLALTRKEAQTLLADLKQHYNRQVGIKWIDLWDLIDSSGYGRKMTKQEVTGFVEHEIIVIAPRQP